MCTESVLRIASAMEAGDHHNPMLLQLEEYSVRNTLPHAAVPGKPREIAWDVPRWPQPSPRLPVRNVRRVHGVCSRTMPALLSSLRPVSRQPAASRLLERVPLTCSQGMTAEGFCS